MKKIVLLMTAFMLSIVFINCSKDEDNEKGNKPVQNELDIESIVNLINTPVDNVKNEMASATLINESNTLGQIALSYQLPTKEAGYLLSFKFNESNLLYSLSVSSSEKYSNYSEAINFTKKLSDRINKIYANKKFNGFYMDGTSYNARFDTPEEYWNYITQHPVKDSSYEFRILKNGDKEGGKMIYQNIELWFLRQTNNFAILVERNEY